MPGSGICASDECFAKFQEMKLKKNVRCIVFKISDDLTEMHIHKVFRKNECHDQAAHYAKILEEIQNDGYNKKPFFLVWDLEVPGKCCAGGKTSGGEKLAFMGLCLDELPVKAKMMYSTSVKALTDKLEGIPKSKCIDIKDMDDLKFDNFLKKISQ